jgi:hypothetical protein
MSATPAAAGLLAGAASLLDQGRALDRLSNALTVGALVALVAMAVLGVREPVPVALLALSVLAGATEVYLAVRVGFDAALLRDLASGPDAHGLANLDAALTSLGLLPASKVDRPLEQRVAGACRLFYRQGGALAAQIALFLVGAVAAALL